MQNWLIPIVVAGLLFAVVRPTLAQIAGFPANLAVAVGEGFKFTLATPYELPVTVDYWIVDFVPPVNEDEYQSLLE